MKRKMIVEYCNDQRYYTVERKFLFWWIPAIDRASRDWLQKQIIDRFLVRIPETKKMDPELVKRTIGLLERIQHCSPDDSEFRYYSCPECVTSYPNHSDDCELKSVLNELRGESK